MVISNQDGVSDCRGGDETDIKLGNKNAIIISNAFPIEEDSNNMDQHEPGAKLDAGKAMASVIAEFGLALLEVAKVGTHGIEKYSRGGWLHVENGIERYDDAMWRHLLQQNTSKHDAQSGLRHDAQAVWNALAKLELTLREEKKVEVPF